MKKSITLIIIALLVCVSSAVSLTSCSFNFELGSEGFVEYAADGKEDSMELFSGFFEDTVNNANVVVTVKSEGAVQYVENIEGTKNLVEYNTNGVKAYAFPQGDEYIVAIDSEDGKYIMTGKDSYDRQYCYFMRSFDMIGAVTEDKATFNCVSRVEEKETTVDGEQIIESTGTLTFDIVTETGTININVAAENGLVTTVTLTVNDTAAGTNRTTTMTFEYGGASVTTPDVTGWADASSPDEGTADE